MKAIKTKIKSVKNIKQITKALEIVSTVKLKKVKEATDNYRNFTNTFLKTIYSIQQQCDIFEEPEKNEEAKDLILVVSSEKGLCGSLNAKITKMVNNDYTSNKEKTDIYCIGKKSKEFFKRNNFNIVGQSNITDNLDNKDIEEIATFLKKALESKKYGSIRIAFNYFKNAIQQIPMYLTLFPLTKEEFDTFLTKINIEKEEQTDNQKHIELEPNDQECKENIQKMIIQHMTYGTILQNKAGEFAARMIAMKNASDNSTELIKDLTNSFNKARQAAITQEISEIVSAKVSMEG